MSNLENKAWRSVQIAAMLLYRCFKPSKIENAISPLFDLLITQEEALDLRFGVVVRNSTFKNSSQFEGLVNSLQKSSFNSKENRVPILLMCVNESTETASFGFLVSWRFGNPRVYNNFEMKQMTVENAINAKNIIRAMDNVIRVLDENSFNILKRITFSCQVRDGRIQNGEFLYLRKFSDEYKMKQRAIVSEKEKFSRLMKGIPEDEYPSDIVDSIIFESVRQVFQNAEQHTSLILFSTELLDLQNYNRYSRRRKNVEILPEVGQLNPSVAQFLNGMEIPTIPFELYLEFVLDAQILEQGNFSISYPVQEWIGICGELKRLLPTVKLVSSCLELND